MLVVDVAAGFGFVVVVRMLMSSLLLRRWCCGDDGDCSNGVRYVDDRFDVEERILVRVELHRLER